MKENRFYVYGHYLKENNNLFYIGKGTGDRFHSRSGRSKGWIEITSKNDWYPAIIVNNLTNSEALTKEMELIETNINLVNHKRTSTECSLNFQEVNSKFIINNNSKTGLSLRTTPLDSDGIIKYTKNRTKATYIVRFKGKSYLAHRVVWLLHYGSISSEMVIDHIDGNSLNNKIENLREVTVKSNNENKKLYSSNKSGVAGVIMRILNNSVYYASKYTLNGIKKHKVFSAKKYGILPAFAMAVLYRWKGIEEANSLGSNYTNRDGTHSPIKLELNQLKEYNFQDISGVNSGYRKGFMYYSANYHFNGKIISKTFNVSKHGLLPALAKAIEFRRNGILKLEEQRK